MRRSHKRGGEREVGSSVSPGPTSVTVSSSSSSSSRHARGTLRSQPRSGTGATKSSNGRDRSRRNDSVGDSGGEAEVERPTRHRIGSRSDDEMDTTSSGRSRSTRVGSNSGGGRGAGSATRGSVLDELEAASTLLLSHSASRRSLKTKEFVAEPGPGAGGGAGGGAGASRGSPRGSGGRKDGGATAAVVMAEEARRKAASSMSSSQTRHGGARLANADLLVLESLDDMTATTSNGAGADVTTARSYGSGDAFQRHRATPSGRRSTTDSYMDLFSDQRIVYLNVGGTRFATSRATLSKDPDSMLSIMVNGDMATARDGHGALFIDRDPTHFRYILNLLRDGAVDLPNDEEVLAQLLREADFYQIEELIRLIETKQRKMRRTIVPIQRENLLLMLHSTSRLQLPSTCLMGLNLSYLKLGASTFMAANMTGVDLTHAECEKTIFTRACLKDATLANCNLSEAKLDGADLTGAGLQKAQLYKADLKGACLRDADLTRANLQDANLKGVNLQGANLSKAILIAADLRGFNLERANLQGANLEGACLRGVNLRGANLRGANLWNATLRDADLHGAVLREANLQRADLTGITGTFLR